MKKKKVVEHEGRYPIYLNDRGDNRMASVVYDECNKKIYISCRNDKPSYSIKVTDLIGYDVFAMEIVYGYCEEIVAGKLWSEIPNELYDLIIAFYSTNKNDWKSF